MMITRLEFQSRAMLDHVTLDAWIEEEWLVPAGTDGGIAFSDADLARAQLILDLTRDLGVNSAGVGVILHLLDQVHGLRSALASVRQAARGKDDDRP